MSQASEAHKKAMNNYRRAYEWANGEQKAGHLILTYHWGWYNVNGTQVRRGELERMTRALWQRKRYQGK